MKLRRLMIAALSASLLAGCAAGNDSVTLKPYTPADGNQAQSGSIKLRNFLVVAQPDGSGVIIGTAVNSADTSEEITSMTVNNIPVVVNPAQMTLNKNQPLIFGGESATAMATVPGLNVKPGGLVTMSVSFTAAAPVTMTVIVRDATGEFATATP